MVRIAFLRVALPQVGVRRHRQPHPEIVKMWYVRTGAYFLATDRRTPPK